MVGTVIKAARTIPAYAEFLVRHNASRSGGGGHDEVQLEDVLDGLTWRNLFERVPIMTKENYIGTTSIAQRGLPLIDFVHTSTGSTGSPTLWGRSMEDELDIAMRFEQIFRDGFRADQRKTLAVICFPLGVWVGGLFTTLCVRYVSCKGYNVALATPGNNPAEIIKAVMMMAPMFEQTVLLGYPPFVKGVIDAGLHASPAVPWSNFKIKLVLAGEVFSEEWRQLVAERAGIKYPETDVVSIYGTADAGVIGNETLLSVTIRKHLAAKPELAKKLFGKERLPTLLQYDPTTRFLEPHEDGTVVLTPLSTNEADCVSLPTIRYYIGDAGGCIQYEAMKSFLAEHDFDPVAEAKQISDRGYRQLPFAWVFGRTHWTISLYGANVYVENIMVALEQVPVCQFVTGKFVLYKSEDADQDVRLAVIVELAPKVEVSDERKETVAGSILKELLRLNSEFSNYVPKERQLPIVELRLFGDSTYFPVGVKHRYTKD